MCARESCHHPCWKLFRLNFAAPVRSYQFFLSQLVKSTKASPNGSIHVEDHLASFPGPTKREPGNEAKDHHNFSKILELNMRWSKLPWTLFFSIRMIKLLLCFYLMILLDSGGKCKWREVGVWREISLIFTAAVLCYCNTGGDECDKFGYYEGFLILKAGKVIQGCGKCMCVPLTIINFRGWVVLQYCLQVSRQANVSDS